MSSYSYVDNDNSIERLTRELLVMHYSSKFLYLTSITYFPCSGPDYYEVSGIMNQTPGQTEGGGVVAYDPNWPPNTKIIPGCFQGGIFFYKIISHDTINKISYQNVIYSELRSIDSSMTNPYMYVRKIGILKYYELDRLYKINRSYSLLRYKVIQ